MWPSHVSSSSLSFSPCVTGLLNHDLLVGGGTAQCWARGLLVPVLRPPGCGTGGGLTLRRWGPRVNQSPLCTRGPSGLPCGCLQRSSHTLGSGRSLAGARRIGALVETSTTNVPCAGLCERPAEAHPATHPDVCDPVRGRRLSLRSGGSSPNPPFHLTKIPKHSRFSFKTTSLRQRWGYAFGIKDK